MLMVWRGTMRCSGRLLKMQSGLKQNVSYKLMATENFSPSAVRCFMPGKDGIAKRRQQHSSLDLNSWRVMNALQARVMQRLHLTTVSYRIRIKLRCRSWRWRCKRRSSVLSGIRWKLGMGKTRCSLRYSPHRIGTSVRKTTHLVCSYRRYRRGFRRIIRRLLFPTR